MFGVDVVQERMAEILDGRAMSETLRQRVRHAVEHLAKGGVRPALATVLVGEHPASLSYVRGKHRSCEEAGIESRDIRLPEQTSEADLLEIIKRLNADSDVHGILVQQPLPSHLSAERLVGAVAPEKDVDGFHPVNLGRLMRGQRGLLPCTPAGILKMLELAELETRGKHAVVVGRSLLVGKPVAELLLQKSESGNATVSVCHSATPDLGAITRQADILIAAIGRPEFIDASMVRSGAVVIDVGINRVDDPSRKRGYRLVGDVTFDEVARVASHITPVPRGVGPMTVAMLLYNTVQAAAGRSSQSPLPGED
ncbi:MAG: bifunctional methylenetetrahydrofolate dehydrogenase/methenyltetrahydrofolate cyclohydrolase FolD [Spirochaetales bacterium]